MTISLGIKMQFLKLLHFINVAKHQYNKGSKCINLL